MMPSARENSAPPSISFDRSRHRLAEVEKVHSLAERLRLKEVEGLQVPHELYVRLGERGVVERFVLGRGIGETDLLGKDGLPRARRTRHDAERARLEAGPKKEIEVWNPGSQPSHVSLHLRGSGGPRREGAPAV